MEGELIVALKSISVEIVVMALVVFILTMIIKIPIKKFSSKFEEEKRKAFNTIIVFIPAVLSLILSILYYGIFKKTWFNIAAFELSLSVYVVALCIYAIFSRVANIINSIKSEKVNVETLQDDMMGLNQDIEDLTAVLKQKQASVSGIVSKIEELSVLKASIENSKTQNSLVSIEDIVADIANLTSQKKSLESDIKTTEKTLKKLEKTKE